MGESGRQILRLFYLLKKGEILARGRPEEVLTEQIILRVFGLEVRVVPDLVSGSPPVIL
jgi:iron complex transport system ATP-binding protein